MNFIRKRLERLIENESSPARLAKSCAVGVGIALSPYLGIQTLFVFLLSWIFKLNTRVVFTVSYVINNPWTMIPIAVFDYLVGAWTAALFHINLAAYNPTWMQWFNAWLNKKVGHYMCRYINIADLSFWAYIIGGHIVAITGGVIAYFLAKRFFAHLIEKRDFKNTQSV